MTADKKMMQMWLVEWVSRGTMSVERGELKTQGWKVWQKIPRLIERMQ
jgi:hypothetical protein